jgi:hypothetical protein
MFHSRYFHLPLTTNTKILCAHLPLVDCPKCNQSVLFQQSVKCRCGKTIHLFCVLGGKCDDCIEKEQKKKKKKQGPHSPLQSLQGHKIPFMEDWRFFHLMVMFVVLLLPNQHPSPTFSFCACVPHSFTPFFLRF